MRDTPIKIFKSIIIFKFSWSKVIFLFSFFLQIYLFNIRPDLEDKGRYRELLDSFEYIPRYIFLTKEPIFSMIAYLCYKVNSFFFFGQNYSLEIFNVISSFILSLSFLLIYRSKNVSLFYLFPLFFFYDFVYLTVETLRVHLALGLFIFSLYFVNRALYSILFAIAAVLTHFGFFVFFIPFFLNHFFKKYIRNSTCLFIILFSLTFFFLFLIGYFSIDLSFFAGFDLESSRRFILARVILFSLIIFFTSYLFNTDFIIKSIFYTGLYFTGLFFVLGFSEMSLRLLTLTVLLWFILFLPYTAILYRARIIIFVLFFLFVMAYDLISPFRLLFGD
jgi:hypothetical protein